MQLIRPGSGYSPEADCLRDFSFTRKIVAFVWHDMEGFLPGALARWNSIPPVAGAHLCVLRTGEIVLTVRPEDAAYHAGTHNKPGVDGYGRTPFWRLHNINPFSLGVELEGFLVGGYTDAQAAGCRKISDWGTQKYGILREHTMDRLEGHHLHGELSSSRSDPGPHWDWAWVL